MRLTRKTMVALGVSGALTVMAGVSASAAVLDLPILGFGEAANESGAPPQVVHRTVYDDHYVTATTAPKAEPPATSGAVKAAPGTITGAAAPAPAAAPAAAFSAASVPAPQTPAPTTPAVTEPPETAPPATSGRPPVPAGCTEPEWDSEHQAWHCSNMEFGDDH